jgi:hypothetical protein
MIWLARLVRVIGILLALFTCTLYPLRGAVLVSLAPLQTVLLGSGSESGGAPLRCVAYPPYPNGIDCDRVSPGARIDYIKVFYPDCFIKLTRVQNVSPPTGMVGTVDAASTCGGFSTGAVVLVTFSPLRAVVIGNEPVEPTATVAPVEPTPTVAAAGVVQ